MKASEANLLNFLKKSAQFVIPIYQRTYSWTERECRQLWSDVLRAGLNDNVSAHFVGSIVYIEKGLYQVSTQSPLLVIDGQQRLTTVTLLLAALANAIENHNVGKVEPIEGFSSRKIRNYYLLNPEENEELRFKLILSQTDKNSLIAILDGVELPKEKSYAVASNYKLFEKLISENGHDLVAICKGLSKLVIVDVALNRDQDNPQLIFESMNSTGRELSQADLIRNFILMGLEPILQTRLYEYYWRPMEVDFGQKAYVAHFDSFMRHYLTVKTGNIPKVGDVYEAFKAYSRFKEVADLGVDSLVKDIREYSKHFCAMAFAHEEDSDLKMVFEDLRELKVDVAYPFLLELYQDYKEGILQKADFVTAVRLVEAYVFRRAICSIPTNSMNTTFATFMKVVNRDQYLESIKAHFLILPSYKRFPDDEEFKREMQVRDLYNFRLRSYWLRRLENFKRKERVVVDEYTIEHILPQNKNLRQEWQNDLGNNWEEIQNKWLHTLGNLTLTGFNSEFSDRSFLQKRDLKGGFRESPLYLNHGLGNLDKWDEESIKNRGQQLASIAKEVWSAPLLPTDILSSYQTKKNDNGIYVIDDYPNLLEGPIRELFHCFRTEIIRLDPCITEEFLKFYIAYKAETNFVDVVPQVKRLRLNLNIPFNELVDTKKVCRDVTGIGGWGNGDVEVGLSSLNEIPYVIGLVRQAFEHQMGDVR